jgi:endogenous inhibitor of DNA gyrase (YacG/DUF329 family)
MMTEQKQKTPRIFKCPSCSTSIIYDVKNPYRPFCSSRCKDDDIISWAKEGYRIEGKAPQTEEEFLELQKALELKDD